MEILVVTYVGLLVSMFMALSDKVKLPTFLVVLLNVVCMHASIIHVHSILRDTESELSIIKSSLIYSGLATYTPKVVGMEFILLPVKAEQALDYGDPK